MKIGHSSNFDLVKCEFPLKCIVHLYTDYTVCFPTFHYQSLFLPICGTGLHAHLIRTCTDMYIRHCSDIQCVSSQFSASCLVCWFPIPVRNTSPNGVLSDVHFREGINGWPRGGDLLRNAQKDPMLGPIEIMECKRDSPHFEPRSRYKLAIGILG